jgi:hypothetical protein
MIQLTAELRGAGVRGAELVEKLHCDPAPLHAAKIPAQRAAEILIGLFFMFSVV